MVSDVFHYESINCCVFFPLPGKMEDIYNEISEY
jgi:hypothetical protein